MVVTKFQTKQESKYVPLEETYYRKTLPKPWGIEGFDIPSMWDEECMIQERVLWQQLLRTFDQKIRKRTWVLEWVKLKYDKRTKLDSIVYYYPVPDSLFFRKMVKRVFLKQLETSVC